ncbi:MipA/OmpV family protein [Chitinibacter bivalviorum]|uniref:MipA/OmpV family protein n=1 Tax=Chitinibacter bivalviorum TaxID=2739434 RepID=UPI001C5376EE|nr:MipA/OmpV family protein [Chitinibacter bivalviorum]
MSSIPCHAEVDMGSLAVSPLSNHSASSPIPDGFIVGGVGLYGQSRYQAESNTTMAIPGFLYFGSQFLFLGDRVRYYVYNQDALSAYLYGRVRMGNLNPADNAAFAGMNKRKWELEAGLGGSYITPYAVLSTRAASDVTGTSNGQELLLWADFPISRDNWLIMPGAGVFIRSANFSNYYFGGVSASEATATRPAWNTGTTVDVGFSLITSYRFNKNWLGTFSANYELYDSSIRNSPLVQHRGELYVIAGLGYMW